MKNKIKHFTEYLIYGRTNDQKDTLLLKTKKSLTEALQTSDYLYTWGYKDIKIVREDKKVETETVFEISNGNWIKG